MALRSRYTCTHLHEHRYTHAKYVHKMYFNFYILDFIILPVVMKSKKMHNNVAVRLPPFLMRFDHLVVTKSLLKTTPNQMTLSIECVAVAEFRHRGGTSSGSSRHAIAAPTDGLLCLFWC